MLTAFATELNSTQSELEALLAKVEALKGQIKTLKAAENKVLKVVENLKNLVSELPEVAINELKKEILSLFPSNPEPTPVTEVFTNFVTEVPKAEEAQPWNSTHFEPLEFQAEDNGQLNLLQPTTTEPPEPDDYPDVASFEKAWEEWGKKQPEIETAIAKVNVSELCFYLKKPNQEIVAAYFAMANRNVGKEWADYLNLMGCIAEVKKAENFANGVRWEVKATRIYHDLILQVDKNRPSLYSNVPAGNAEYTKKSTTGNGKTGENLDDSKTPQLQSNSPKESVEITTEKILLTN
ncbi:hypothetical protein [Floridanema evergladense]|uniref:Uncharacterized protein n=1 Tax=Floridaenema evergladense BLCC-F167 TaxID=3153639 RepID=A0ABV4WGA0_9CYAN